MNYLNHSDSHPDLKSTKKLLLSWIFHNQFSFTFCCYIIDIKLYLNSLSGINKICNFVSKMSLNQTSRTMKKICSLFNLRWQNSNNFVWSYIHLIFSNEQEILNVTCMEWFHTSLMINESITSFYFSISFVPLNFILFI